MNWKDSAPANIALIKYMGKINSDINLPTNSSLSYTLNHLHTTVTLNLIDSNEDKFKTSDETIKISEPAQARFINHLKKLKYYFRAEEHHFLIESKNNFPSDCGLASSASSFAALTKVTCLALSELTGLALPNLQTQAQLSQLGSGSSCRSFFSPWCLWQAKEIDTIDVGYKHLLHQVIVVSQKKKAVTTSAAHQQVSSSLLFNNRPERAEIRCQNLIQALQKNNWRFAYEICWQEFWDMHALFYTAQPPFSYLLPDTLHILNYLYKCWQDADDGALITLDAGPNIHLLYRPEQWQLAQNIKNVFAEQYLILSSNEHAN